ncbi:MAG: lipopolysaccharide biosynthesis protein [Sphingorhabdus sp.]
MSVNVSNWYARWRDSTLVRPRLQSIGHLLSGSVANALIMLAGAAIAARALGPAAYGVMALVLTVGRVSERLVRFESWQPLIRFAAQEGVSSDPQRMSQLYLYGLILDIVGALLAAFISIILVLFFASLIHLESNDIWLVAIYAIAIAVNVRGMPTAALRMDGSFRQLAYFQMVSSVLRVILAYICMQQAIGIYGFMIVWTVAQIFDSMLMLALGFRALRKNNIPNPLRADFRSMKQNFPGFLSFAWSTNLSSTLRTMTQEADTLLVGALAGTPAAGMYHIAKRMAKVAQQGGGHVQTVMYPDMSRIWAAGNIKRFRRMTVQIQAALATFAVSMILVTWLGGEWLIRVGFGADYNEAYPLLMTQLIAVGLILHAAPSRSAMLAMNQPKLVLWIALLSTIVFFGVAALVMPTYGALGANIAHIGFAGVSAILMDYFWLSGSRKAQQLAATPQPVSGG